MFEFVGKIIMINQALSFIENEIEFETEHIKELENFLKERPTSTLIEDANLLLKNHKHRLENFQTIASFLKEWI